MPTTTEKMFTAIHFGANENGQPLFRARDSLAIGESLYCLFARDHCYC